MATEDIAHELEAAIGALERAREILRAASTTPERRALLEPVLDHITATLDARRPSAGALDGRSARPLDDATRRLLADERRARLNAEVGQEELKDRLGEMERERDAAVNKVDEVARDLTDARSDRDDAEQGLAQRDRFIAVATHELKTPLSALSLRIQSLVRSAREDATNKIEPHYLFDSLRLAKRQIDRLETLIGALLDVSKIRSGGEFELIPSDVDLSAVARNAVALLNDEFSNAGCAVTVETEPPVIGRWDQVRLEQVAMNLLTNAIKYAPGRPIEIRVYREVATALLVIRDHGPGIAADDLERIFGRGERASSSYRGGSLGLGLFIAREIVQAHRGTIDAQSRTGDGTTFTMRLPLSA